jgi:hypothetical protein
MEKGLSASAKLSVRRASGHVYDLVRHVAVPASASPGAMEFEAQLGPGEGRVFLISEQAIAAVRIAAPDSAAIAKSFPVRVEVVDAAGQPVSAVIPLQIEILDSAGHLVEFSGYYGAKDGQVSLTVDVARNDPPGRWTVRARELASGRVSEKRFNVE